MLSAERFLIERKEVQAPLTSFKKGEYINLLRWSEMGQMRQQLNQFFKDDFGIKAAYISTSVIWIQCIRVRITLLYSHRIYI